jgi:hypothetical protein
MADFWAKWRFFSWLVSGWLVTACGLACLVGAYGLVASDGPIAVAVIFALMGIALIAGVWVGHRRGYRERTR